MWNDYEKLDFTLPEFQALMEESPEAILNDRYLFRWGLENLFFILNKEEEIVPLTLKEAQSRLLWTYFDCKETAVDGEIGAQIIILKSRQQGMTTLIAAICVLELMLRTNRTSFIVAHDKGNVAQKIFRIYERYLEYFPFSEWFLNKKRDGDGYKLHNGSVIDVSYEAPRGIVGVTTRFMHLSEAGRFRDLSTFLGSFMPGVPKSPISSVIIESTAEKSNDHYHLLWKASEAGNNKWTPVFYPWYIDEDNWKEIPAEEREEFEESLQHREDDKYGNEIALFEEYDDITLEHLYKRRDLIDDSPHGLASFKREFPTTPEEAFMGVNRPVFDIPTLRWMEQNWMTEPLLYGDMEIGEEQMIHQQTRFEPSPQGIIKVYEPPQKGDVYLMGSDHSEGMNDWNAALIAKQHPFEIVAEMIGFEGHNPMPREFARQMFHLGKWYNEAWICPENNPPGNAIIDLLVEWQYPNLVSETSIFPEKGSSGRYGWRNTADTRKAALEVARDIVKQRLLVIPSLKLLRQLEHFVTKTIDGGARAKDQALRKGEYKAIGEDVDQFCDDLVFAMLGLFHARRAIGPPQPKHHAADVMLDENEQIWITETIGEFTQNFGEPVQAPVQQSSWKDYA